MSAKDTQIKNLTLDNYTGIMLLPLKLMLHHFYVIEQIT